jgi:hypothetical protein
MSTPINNQSMVRKGYPSEQDRVGKMEWKRQSRYLEQRASETKNERQGRRLQTSRSAKTAMLVQIHESCRSHDAFELNLRVTIASKQAKRFKV